MPGAVTAPYAATCVPAARFRDLGPKLLSPRAAAGLILSHSDTLDELQLHQFKTVLGGCPELTALTEHVRTFATMLAQRQGRSYRAGSLPSTARTCSVCTGPCLTSKATSTSSSSGSPFAGALESSKGTSTASRCSNARCSAEPDFRYAGREQPAALIAVDIENGLLT